MFTYVYTKLMICLQQTSIKLKTFSMTMMMTMMDGSCYVDEMISAVAKILNLVDEIFVKYYILDDRLQVW